MNSSLNVHSHSQKLGDDLSVKRFLCLACCQAKLGRLFVFCVWTECWHFWALQCSRPAGHNKCLYSIVSYMPLAYKLVCIQCVLYNLHVHTYRVQMYLLQICVLFYLNSGMVTKNEATNIYRVTHLTSCKMSTS